MIVFSKLDPLDYVESKGSMLDLLNRPSFLALRPLHMGKLAPVIILL
jgi:hypothetical protein